MDQAQRFYESFDRCLARTGFLRAFYDRLMARSDEVREKFSGVDMGAQVRHLRASLHLVAMLNDSSGEAQRALQDIARRHSREDLDIRPDLYDEWLECLLSTVAEFDHTFDAEVEAAWRETLAPGVEFMRRHY